MEINDLSFTLMFSVIVVNFLSFASGNAYAWSSPVLLSLKTNDQLKNPLGRPVTSFEESWIVSLLSLGAAVGPLLAGFCLDKIGRKKTLMIFAVPMMSAHLMLAFASTTTEYYVARFMMGLGAGCVSTVIPIYVGEIAKVQVRGLLGSIMGLSLSLGYLFVYSIGSFLNISQLSTILIVPIGVFLIFFGFFVPESPHFYIAVGDERAAQQSLDKLRNSIATFEELASIREQVQHLKVGNFFSDILKSRSFKRGIFITTTLMIFQQFVGITIVLSYMEPIFIATGSSLSSSTSTIVVSSIQVITVLLVSLLVDKWGRKILLIIASAGCAVSSAVIGIFFYLEHIGLDVSELWWLPIFGLMVYIITYNSALSTLPWVLVGELFSSRTKAIASTATAFTCLFLAFVTTLIFPTLDRTIGLHGTFGIFSLSGLGCLVFVLKYVPETKGKSSQEILKILDR